MKSALSSLLFLSCGVLLRQGNVRNILIVYFFLFIYLFFYFFYFFFCSFSFCFLFCFCFCFCFCFVCVCVFFFFFFFFFAICELLSCYARKKQVLVMSLLVFVKVLLNTLVTMYIENNIDTQLSFVTFTGTFGTFFVTNTPWVPKTCPGK